MHLLSNNAFQKNGTLDAPPPHSLGSSTLVGHPKMILILPQSFFLPRVDGPRSPSSPDFVDGANPCMKKVALLP